MLARGRLFETEPELRVELAREPERDRLEELARELDERALDDRELDERALVAFEPPDDRELEEAEAFELLPPSRRGESAVAKSAGNNSRAASTEAEAQEKRRLETRCLETVPDAETSLDGWLTVDTGCLLSERRPVSPAPVQASNVMVT